MSGLYRVTALVKNILENDERARNSDSFLYLKVLDAIGVKNGIDINSMSIPVFLLSINELGFPKFETVRRTRQKIQAEFPELSANKQVKTQRALNEKEFREYARRLINDSI